MGRKEREERGREEEGTVYLLAVGLIFQFLIKTADQNTTFHRVQSVHDFPQGPGN